MALLMTPAKKSSSYSAVENILTKGQGYNPNMSKSPETIKKEFVENILSSGKKATSGVVGSVTIPTVEEKFKEKPMSSELIWNEKLNKPYGTVTAVKPKGSTKLGKLAFKELDKATFLENYLKTKKDRQQATPLDRASYAFIRGFVNPVYAVTGNAIRGIEGGWNFVTKPKSRESTTDDINAYISKFKKHPIITSKETSRGIIRGVREGIKEEVRETRELAKESPPTAALNVATKVGIMWLSGKATNKVINKAIKVTNADKLKIVKKVRKGENLDKIKKSLKDKFIYIDKEDLGINYIKKIEKKKNLITKKVKDSKTITIYDNKNKPITLNVHKLESPVSYSVRKNLKHISNKIENTKNQLNKLNEIYDSLKKPKKVYVISKEGKVTLKRQRLTPSQKRVNFKKRQFKNKIENTKNQLNKLNEIYDSLKKPKKVYVISKEGKVTLKRQRLTPSQKRVNFKRRQFKNKIEKTTQGLTQKQILLTKQKLKQSLKPKMKVYVIPPKINLKKLKEARRLIKKAKPKNAYQKEILKRLDFITKNKIKEINQLQKGVKFKPQRRLTQKQKIKPFVRQKSKARINQLVENKLKSKPQRRLIQKQKIKPFVRQKSKARQILLTKQKPKFKNRFNILGIGTLSLSRSRFKQKFKLNEKQKFKQATKSKSVIKQVATPSNIVSEKTIQSQKKLTPLKQITTTTKIIIREPKIKLFKFPNKRKYKIEIKTKSKNNGGYNVYAKELKINKKQSKFIKINRTPLTKKRALDLRNYIIDNSLSRTGEIRVTSQKPKNTKYLNIPLNYSSYSKHKFRNVRLKNKKQIKLNKNRIIEKGKYMNDTKNEKRNLSLKRLINKVNTPKIKHNKKR